MKAEAGNRKCTKNVKSFDEEKPLRGIEVLPPDNLYDVAFYLDPADLLNLCWTSKPLRRILAHSSSSFVWALARQNVLNLPLLPSGLSEIHFAHFAYSTGCQLCQKKVKLYPLWSKWQRYCHDCLKYNDSFIRLSEATTPKYMAIRVPEDRDLYLVALYAEYQSFQRRIQLSAVSYNKQIRAENSSSMAREVDRVRPSFEKWFAFREKEHQIAEGRKLRELRFQSVIARISEEGWAEEISLMSNDVKAGLRAIPGVFDVYDFGGKSWIILQHHLIQYLHYARHVRLTEEQISMFAAA